MVLELSKFKEMLCIVNINNNPNKGYILEEIKNELGEVDESQYQEWEKTGFNLDHKFTVQDFNLTYAPTLLSLAVKGGYKMVVNALIEGGADVNIADEYGDTSLHWAVLRKNKKVMKLLIEAKADVNIANERGTTPLYIAARDGNTKITKILIRAGANPNITNEDGKSPLYIAVQNGSTKIVTTLIGAGADVNIRHEDVCTVLDLAILEYRTKIAKALMRAGADVNIRHEDGSTPLHLAIRHGCDINLIMELTKRSNNVNQADKEGDTPLLAALRSNLRGVRGVRRCIIRRALIQDIERPDEFRRCSDWDECEDEIKDTIKKKIGKSMISYLDLLKANENEMVTYVRNHEIREVLESPDFEFKREFPVFGGDIKDKYDEGKKKQDLINAGSRVITELSGPYKLPSEISNKIATYLSNVHLKNLKDAVNER